MRRGTKQAAAAVALMSGGGVILRPGTHANHVARHGVDVAARRLRHLAGRLHGVSYRMRGGAPDPDVTDELLADRVRSSIGGLEKRLDIPHVHVMAEGHVVLLHGSVGSADDADAIVQAVAGVPGVAAVESHLHVGIAECDTRPSEGRSAQHR